MEKVGWLGGNLLLLMCPWGCLGALDLRGFGVYLREGDVFVLDPNRLEGLLIYRDSWFVAGWIVHKAVYGEIMGEDLPLRRGYPYSV